MGARPRRGGHPKAIRSSFESVAGSGIHGIALLARELGLQPVGELLDPAVVDDGEAEDALAAHPVEGVRAADAVELLRRHVALGVRPDAGQELSGDRGLGDVAVTGRIRPTSLASFG